MSSHLDYDNARRRARRGRSVSRPSSVVSAPRYDREQEAVLVARWRAGDWRAREALVLSQLGYVKQWATRIAARSGVSYDDLYSEGTLGLIMAVDRYDETRGNRLSAITVPYIRGFMAHLVTRVHTREGNEFGVDDPADLEVHSSCPHMHVTIDVLSALHECESRLKADEVAGACPHRRIKGEVQRVREAVRKRLGDDYGAE